MKVSLAWIFDHISAERKREDVDQIVSLFNQITAEIESIHHWSYDLDSLAFALFQEAGAAPYWSFYIPEWDISLQLPARQSSDDEILKHPDIVFLVKREKDEVRFAMYADIGSDREGELPAFFCRKKELWSGAWKHFVEADDVIFEVDNKSLTHRPDMWGHRGFAREVAAFLKLPFRNETEFLVEKEIRYGDKTMESTQDQPLAIEVDDAKACAKFAGLYLKDIENKPSDFFMAMRLIRVGSRPISLLVDLTNYVMLDFSQPMHA